MAGTLWMRTEERKKELRMEFSLSSASLGLHASRRFMFRVHYNKETVELLVFCFALLIYRLNFSLFSPRRHKSSRCIDSGDGARTHAPSLDPVFHPRTARALIFYLAVLLLLFFLPSALVRKLWTRTGTNFHYFHIIS
jgi:hypothetical protein